MRIFSAFITIFLFAFSIQNSQAQIQIGAHGAYAISTPKVEGDKNTWGGGLQARYFITPQFAAGVGVNLLSQKVDFAGVDVKTSILPITAMAEYFFTEEGIRPYAGVKTGIYVQSVSALGSKESESVFGVAPKIGLQVPIVDNLALFAEGEYNFMFNKKEYVDQGADKTERYIQLNLGVVYTLNFK
ncbi:OmpW family outer membrane protein [Siphonobacter curvatus]|uniref:Outer membrane protein beta-barrel domain-containing protein n=1 Tax=Siphonobacter curvatus TaxID=2094562 RepID=A0A2S7IIC6_9BACT|nr:OmpW family outer membrane protein [Siphonobacter curvatus]PQA56148.1 hypothetical protein C5O19_17485 [Siphonobacter curvatus]